MSTSCVYRNSSSVTYPISQRDNTEEEVNEIIPNRIEKCPSLQREETRRDVRVWRSVIIIQVDPCSSHVVWPCFYLRLRKLHGREFNPETPSIVCDGTVEAATVYDSVFTSRIERRYSFLPNGVLVEPPALKLGAITCCLPFHP